MSKNYETGHAINLANLKKLIAFLKTFVSYNPSNVRLTIKFLEDLYAEAEAAQENLRQKNVDMSDAVNARQRLFDGINLLSSDIMRTLKTSEADPKNYADAETFHRKIQGSRKGGNTKQEEPVKEGDPKPDPADQNDNTHSVSQRSFDNLLDNFKSLVLILTIEPKYAPNETHLTLAALNARIADMEAANNTVINCNSFKSTAKGNRDNLFYAVTTGLVDTANNAKLEVKRVYTINSSEYKSVQTLEFNNKRGKR